MKKEAPPTRIEHIDAYFAEAAALQAEVNPQNPMLDTPAALFRGDERKPRRINTTFSLEPEVVKLIEQIAKKYDISRSRVVEKMAYSMLGLKKKTASQKVDSATSSSSSSSSSSTAPPPT